MEPRRRGHGGYAVGSAGPIHGFDEDEAGGGLLWWSVAGGDDDDDDDVGACLLLQALGLLRVVSNQVAVAVIDKIRFVGLSYR